MSASAKIVLRKKPNAIGLYPLAIRITKNRRSTYKLIGHYIDVFKTLVITDTLLPKFFDGSPTLFKRSLKGLYQSLEKFYNKEPKKYYVGEWHTHPNGSTMYSQTDLNAMMEIESCETVNIKNPILLILSINKTKMRDYTFYLFENKKLLKYEK